jgi:hypothetical protein
MAYPLLFTFLILSALRCETTQEQFRNPPLPDPHVAVVLEIIQKDARPRAAGDEYLYFRLYESGKVECESKAAVASSGNATQFHSFLLEDEELDQLLVLAEASLILPNDIDPMQRKEDKAAIIRIRIRDTDGGYRQTLLHQYSPENENTRLLIPAMAKKLLQKVNLLRKKYTWET